MDTEHRMLPVYTPMSDEVREAYGNFWDDYLDLLEAGFDRWLAAHDATTCVAALEVAEATINSELIVERRTPKAGTL